MRIAVLVPVGAAGHVDVLGARGGPSRARKAPSCPRASAARLSDDRDGGGRDAGEGRVFDLVERLVGRRGDLAEARASRARPSWASLHVSIPSAAHIQYWLTALVVARAVPVRAVIAGIEVEVGVAALVAHSRQTAGAVLEKPDARLEAVKVLVEVSAADRAHVLGHECGSVRRAGGPRPRRSRLGCRAPACRGRGPSRPLSMKRMHRVHITQRSASVDERRPPEDDALLGLWTACRACASVLARTPRARGVPSLHSPDWFADGAGRPVVLREQELLNVVARLARVLMLVSLRTLHPVGGGDIAGRLELRLLPLRLVVVRRGSQSRTSSRTGYAARPSA